MNDRLTHDLTVHACTLSRRTLLHTATRWAAAGLLFRATQSLALEDSASDLQVRTGGVLAVIPENFTGLGYEMSSAARLGLLSEHNTSYVHLVRNLGGSGVLRLGGIVADFTRYSPQGEVRTEPRDTVVTRASLQQLRGFLDACQWTAIWSLNFARSTLEEALLEAEDVARILGPRLLAIELGNEVENYGKGDPPIRPAPYTYETWRAEYTRWHAALITALPGLHFAAPDTAASVEWVERTAADARGEVQLLTTHYYRGSQKSGTSGQLAHADPALQDTLARLRQASVKSRLPWRMCETNSFFGGGRPGVSNSLLGALWTLDYMLLLAGAGCAGVNMETGVNQLGFISSYSPIGEDAGGNNHAGAPYYGMLAFAVASREAPEVVAVTQSPVAEGVTIYGLARAGRLRSLVVINRSATQGARVSLRGLRLGAATAIRLTGPSLEATIGIMLGGAAVSPDGTWAPGSGEAVHEAVDVPSASAVVIRTQ